jgi:hypothetical protein
VVMEEGVREEGEGLLTLQLEEEEEEEAAADDEQEEEEEEQQQQLCAGPRWQLM